MMREDLFRKGMSDRVERCIRKIEYIARPSQRGGIETDDSRSFIFLRRILLECLDLRKVRSYSTKETIVSEALHEWLSSYDRDIKSFKNILNHVMEKYFNRRKMLFKILYPLGISINGEIRPRSFHHRGIKVSFQTWQEIGIEFDLAKMNREKPDFISSVEELYPAYSPITLEVVARDSRDSLWMALQMGDLIRSMIGLHIRLAEPRITLRCFGEPQRDFEVHEPPLIAVFKDKILVDQLIAEPQAIDCGLPKNVDLEIVDRVEKSIKMMEKSGRVSQLGVLVSNAVRHYGNALDQNVIDARCLLLWQVLEICTHQVVGDYRIPEIEKRVKLLLPAEDHLREFLPVLANHRNRVAHAQENDMLILREDLEFEASAMAYIVERVLSRLICLLENLSTTEELDYFYKYCGSSNPEIERLSGVLTYIKRQRVKDKEATELVAKSK